MYRPGGFPEYTPKEQKVFDDILKIISTEFSHRNYDHIWTPAVENNDILLKGGDMVANEIFGLIGLKDFERGEIQRAKKKYSLHFDLTVPFARYTLDHLSELTFPFKRYQIQPVWRGERQQSGRFKEFWQCDIDSIWRSGTNVGNWYAIETIATLQITINKILKKLGVKKKIVTHISHIGLIKSYLNKIIASDIQDNKDFTIKKIVDIFDNKYKIDKDEFNNQLSKLINIDNLEQILSLVDQKDFTGLFCVDQEKTINFKKIISSLEKMGCNIVFDPSIVRGLGYYTDVVFETFIEGEIEKGSICSGGGYENFTKFIDSKNVFSGIGGSIGISRLMDVVSLKDKKDKIENIIQYDDKYLFLNFESTFDDILILYKKFLKKNRTCELYPTETKFGKQLEYADKKGIRYAVILGTTELEKGEYQIKDLKTGETTIEKI